MEKIKNAMKLLKEKHPGQIWLLSRFIFAVLCVNCIINVFALLMICVVPFAMLLLGSGWAGFLMWYFAPYLVFIIWILYEICAFIYEEYIYEEYVYDGTD